MVGRLSDHPLLTHEPFNHDRPFGWIAAKFKESGDVVALRADLRTALAERPCTKHCYDLHPLELHRCFLEVTTELGYRHVVLDREDDVGRVLSLMLAKTTGAWGANSARSVYQDVREGTVSLEPIDIARAAKSMQQGDARREWLIDEMRSQGVHPHVLFFEDVYASGSDVEPRVRDLLSFLGVDTGEGSDFRREFEEFSNAKPQNSRQISDHVPNYAEAALALAEIERRPHCWKTPQDAEAAPKRARAIDT